MIIRMLVLNSSSVPPGSNYQMQALQDENDRLTAELREARAQIRNLELQVEGLKANAQKAKALLNL